jgi:ubiquinone/menaquinone biosynthesis C-methylase UbiE
LGSVKNDIALWRALPPGTIPSSLVFAPELIPQHISSRVLDVGCGDGLTLHDIATSPDRYCFGVDLNEPALQRGGRRAHASQVRASFICADAGHLPFKNGAFTVAILQGLLTVVRSPRRRAKVISETVRVLDAGGLLYVAEFLQTWESPEYAARYEVGERETGERGSFIARNALHEGTPYFAHHFDRDELINLIESAGLLILDDRVMRVRSQSGNELLGLVVLAHCPDRSPV